MFEPVVVQLFFLRFQLLLFVLVGCGEREEEEQNSAPPWSSAFPDRLCTLKAFWSVSPVLLGRSSLRLERLEMDEAVLLRRVLGFSPCRFLHKSSHRLSLYLLI